MLVGLNEIDYKKQRKLVRDGANIEINQIRYRDK